MLHRCAGCVSFFCTKQCYGAVYFEPIPEATLVLDLGARFLRGANCNLSGAVLARRDVEFPEAHVDEALALLGVLHDSLLATAGFGGDLVEVATEKLRLAANLQRLEGQWQADDLATRLGLPIRLKKTSTSPLSGSNGWAWRAASPPSSRSAQAKAPFSPALWSTACASRWTACSPTVTARHSRTPETLLSSGGGSPSPLGVAVRLPDGEG